jgi:hypothetical protein
MSCVLASSASSRKVHDSLPRVCPLVLGLTGSDASGLFCLCTCCFVLWLMHSCASPLPLPAFFLRTRFHIHDVRPISFYHAVRASCTHDSFLPLCFATTHAIDRIGFAIAQAGHGATFAVAHLQHAHSRFSCTCRIAHCITPATPGASSTIVDIGCRSAGAHHLVASSGLCAAVIPPHPSLASTTFAPVDADTIAIPTPLTLPRHTPALVHVSSSV